jgi:hypothetical protein
MEILPASKNSSNKLILDGKVVHFVAAPGTTVVNIIRVPINDGYTS